MGIDGALTEEFPSSHTRIAYVHLGDFICQWYIEGEEPLFTFTETGDFTAICCVVYLLNNCLVQASDLIIVHPEHGILLFTKLLKAILYGFPILFHLILELNLPLEHSFIFLSYHLADLHTDWSKFCQTEPLIL